MCKSIIALLSLVVISSATYIADPSTLEGKVMFGYQGWFFTPSDGANVGWRHWTRDPSTADASTVKVDIWPDTSEYSKDVLEATDMMLPDGEPAMLYSSYHQSVMDLHFQWLQDYELDGFFLQRFLAETYDRWVFELRNTITLHMMASAEKHGNTFAIMYDISGCNDDNCFMQFLEDDWNYLVDTLNITASPQYQRHNGKPVVAIWGLGFIHIDVSVDRSLDIIEFFQNKGCYVLGGVPYYWRFGYGDARPDYDDVYKALDALTPWAVGRFDEKGIDWAYDNYVVDDKNETDANNQLYAPVLFPGFSWKNMNPGDTLNQIPRNGGDFLWKQAQNCFDKIDRKNTFLYLAMFDEADEGTAFFKATKNATSPVDPKFVTMDFDGYDNPSDFYLTLARRIANTWRNDSTTRGAVPLAATI